MKAKTSMHDSPSPQAPPRRKKSRNISIINSTSTTIQPSPSYQHHDLLHRHGPPPTLAHLPKLAGGSLGGPSAVTYALVMPPSTTKSVPLTKLLSSLARKRAAWACSMASPKRPEGKWTSRRWRLAASSPSQSWRRGVLRREMVE